MTQARYSPDSQRITWQTIDNEVIIIDLELGNYYTLNGVGAAIWALIEQQATVDQIVAQMQAQYDGAPDTIRAGIDAFLAELAAEKIISAVSEGANAVLETPTPTARVTFEAPVLEKYTDMQTLLLVDPVHQVDDRGWPHEAPSS